MLLELLLHIRSNISSYNDPYVKNILNYTDSDLKNYCKG